MKHKNKRQSLAVVFPFLLTSLLSLSLSADDTEIYFSEATGDADAKPNILFILDNSYSMRFDVDEKWVDYDDPTSRLNILKDTFGRVISGVTDANVGLIRMNDRRGNSKPSVINPIVDVDGTETLPVPSGGYDVPVWKTIDKQQDNKQQGRANSSAVFSLAQSPFGLRFRDLPIPQGAQIISARVVLTSGYDNQGSCQIDRFDGRPIRQQLI